MIQLTRKERRLVLAIVIFCIICAVFGFVIKPAVDRIGTLARVIPEKTEVLAQLRQKSKQYLALRNGMDGVKNTANLEDDDFELLTFLESITDKEHLTRKVTTMQQKIAPLDSNYNEIIVEVGLERLTFEQLVEFLVKIESSNHFLWIKSLYTKKNSADVNLLDTLIHISTLKSN